MEVESRTSSAVIVSSSFFVLFWCLVWILVDVNYAVSFVTLKILHRVKKQSWKIENFKYNYWFWCFFMVDSNFVNALLSHYTYNVRSYCIVRSDKNIFVETNKSGISIKLKRVDDMFEWNIYVCKRTGFFTIKCTRWIYLFCSF